MKKIRIDLLVYILIFVISLIPRLIVTFHQGWLADEVFIVDQVDKWFLNHLGEYIFQINHESYPPVSPYFINPPFAMWMMTVGMYIAEKLNVELLFGARIVNVIFGSITCVLTYILCKKLYDRRVGIIASLILSLSPIYIANNSSAYLDTILSFMAILSLYLFYSFVESGNRRYLYLLAMALGISLITKFIIIPLIILIIIYILYLIINDKNNDKNYRVLISFLIILIITPTILWAGARDINHIHGVIDYVRGLNTGDYQKMFDDYSGLKVGNTSKELYFFLMIFGAITPIIGLSFFVMVIHILIKILYFKQRNLFQQSFMLIVIIFSIIFINYFGGVKSTVHKIIFVVPIITIITTNWLLESIDILSNKLFSRNGKNYVGKNVVACLVLLVAIYPVFVWPPEFYNSYNNFLIGEIQGASALYRVGDGEGLEIVGKWLNENTDPDSKIAVIRFDYLLKKYTNRTLYKQPLNEDIDTSLYAGANYLVVHNSHISGQLQPKINFGELKAEFIVYVKDTPYIYVYNLTGYPYHKKFSIPINISNISDWYGYSKNNKSKVYIYLSDLSTLRIKYEINKGWASINRNIDKTDEIGDGIAIEIYGDEKGSYFELDLYDSNSKAYIRALSNVSWNGWKRFYFDFDEMRRRGNENIDISKIDGLRITITSRENIEGTLYVRNISIIKKDQN